MPDVADTEQHRRMQIAIEGADRLMSINEAMTRGYSKLRLDIWANPDDYMEFSIFDGRPGPWVKLWSPTNGLIGEPDPQKLLITMLGDLDDPCWRALPKTLVRP